MRLLIQAFPLLATTLFLFLPNLATGYPIPEDTPIYDNYTGLYWTGGNFKSPPKTVTWAEAKNWVADLNRTEYGGFDDWRLPYSPPGSVWGYDNTTTITKYEVTVSELGYLYYVSLDQEGFWSKAHCISDNDCSNPNFSATKDFSPFTHLLNASYWFETTEYLGADLAAWSFDFGTGIQFLQSTKLSAHVIAVRGAHPVPEPSSALLLLTGLVGLCRMHHRQASRT